MKIRCMAMTLAIFVGLSARAADGRWTNSAGGSWADGANWFGTTIANGAGATADFSTLDITTNRTVTLDGPRTLGHLIFDDATNPDSDWTLSTGSGGPLTLAVNSGSPKITVENCTATISAILAGTAGLTKAGAGTLVLSPSVNTFTGVTTVNGGQLVIGSSDALVYGTVTVGVGAALDLHSYGTYGGPRHAGIFEVLNVGGTGADGNGALLNSTGVVGNVSAGGYIWNPGAGNQHPTINLTDNTLFNLTTDFGQLNAGYRTTYLNLNNHTLTKGGIGTYYLCNTTVGNGNLSITNGAIVLTRSGSRIQGTGTVTVGDGNGNGTLSLNSFQTSGLITRPVTLNGGKITTTGIAQIDSAITLNATNAANMIDTPYSLTLAGTLSGQGGLTKSDGSTLTLTNTNTYSGDTTIDRGTLMISGAGQLGGGNYGGNITLTNFSAFNYASSAEQTLSGTLSGVGAVVKANSGTLILAGTNTYSNGTFINGGKLIMGSFLAVSKLRAVRVDAGGSFDMHGYSAAGSPNFSCAFKTLTVGGTGSDGNGALLNSTGTVRNVAAGGYIWDVAAAQNFIITLTTNTLFNLESDFGQVGGGYSETQLNLNDYTLTKSGVGSYYLCNNTVGNGNLTITDGAVALNRANGNAGSRIQGTGTVTVGDGNGNGMLSLDSFQTNGLITRPIILNGGKITTTGIAQIDSAITLNATNAANTIDTPFDLTLAGALSGLGGLTKTGIGTLTLTNANTYTGDTIVSNGTLEVVAVDNVTLNDDTTLHIAAGGKLKLNNGVNEQVQYLYLDGIRAARGTWGSKSSSAGHKRDNYFEPGNNGILTVLRGPGGTIIVVR